MPRGIARLGLTMEQSVNPRMLNGASVGLQLPHLTPETVGGLEIRLEHIHPRRAQMAFRLPAGGPVIRIAANTAELEPAPAVLHHVVVDADLDRVFVVWRGAVRTLFPKTQDEAASVPFSVVW